MNLSIAYSPCPNDTFLFHALVHELVDGPKVQWQVHLEDVEQLNRHAAKGLYDVTKLSFHAYAHCWQDYQILDAGSALGFGCGPLLITRAESRDRLVSSMKIAIPGAWTTAHFLFMLAYPDGADKVQMLFSDIEAAVLDGRVDAGVIIHENRFTFAEKGLVCLQDLGAYWEQLTGGPIPLGCIAVRRSLPQSLKIAINEALAQSVRYAFRHPHASSPYVAAHAQELDPEVRRQHIELYVNPFTESLGATGRQAVNQLYREAFQRGIIPAIPEDCYLEAETAREG